MVGGLIMCRECRQVPHHPKCPNALEPIFLGYCELCGEGLREDYEYYTDDNGYRFCSENCAIEFYGIRAKEWTGFD